MLDLLEFHRDFREENFSKWNSEGKDEITVRTLQELSAHYAKGPAAAEDLRYFKYVYEKNLYGYYWEQRKEHIRKARAELKSQVKRMARDDPDGLRRLNV